jgi:hypothetical protein
MLDLPVECIEHCRRQVVRAIISGTVGVPLADGVEMGAGFYRSSFQLLSHLPSLSSSSFLRKIAFRRSHLRKCHNSQRLTIRMPAATSGLMVIKVKLAVLAAIITFHLRHAMTGRVGAFVGRFRSHYPLHSIAPPPDVRQLIFV